VQYFLSVRCALKALCDARRPRSAWIPSHLCDALLAPFVQSGVEVCYYEVDDYLRVTETSWVEDVQAGDLVLVIHYFGFPNAGFPADKVKKRAAMLIEDASQALFLRQQFSESTCILYSPRKFLGVPDSGVMVSDAETGTESAPLQDPPAAWWRSAVALALKRRDFDLTGGPNEWHALFRQVEAAFPVGIYRASDLSKMLLSIGVDYDTIRTRRRANYSRLLHTVGGYAVFPELGQDAVPSGFPVRVNAGARDRVLHHLHAQRIYAPVHWPIDGRVPASFQRSHELALSSITLVCDQRCTLDDMDRQAGEFRAALEQTG